MAPRTKNLEPPVNEPEGEAPVDHMVESLGRQARGRLAPPKKGEQVRRGADGYYVLPDGTACLSVTNVIGKGVPKDLIGWATWEVAKLAVDSVPALVRVRGESARNDMVNWLKGASNRVRDKAANFGSAIHDVAEAKVIGKPVAEPTEDQIPFIEAFENFIADHSPVFHATELTVAHPEHGWAGRCDAWAELPLTGDGICVVDYKTGKGAYGEAAMQMAAYQRATVGWLDDGTEVTPPEAVRAYVLHIRPDKHPDRGYALIPADTSDEVYEYFRAAQRIAEWSMKRSKKALGKPVEVPAVAEEVA